MLDRLKRGAADLVIRELDKRDRQLTRPRFHEENAIDLRALLAEPIEQRNGGLVVLQIGANDGVANDPIRASVLARGWTLYAVEPVPAVFEKLQANYGPDPRYHYINCAVGPQDGTAELFYVDQPEQVDGPGYDQFTSFSREAVERKWRAIPDLKQRLRTLEVEVCTFTTLLERYDVPPVDLLQIDIEGLDYEVLKMAFAAGVQPEIVAFEWVNLSRADMWACRTDLIERGYHWLIDKGDVIASRTTPFTGASRG